MEEKPPPTNLISWLGLISKDNENKNRPTFSYSLLTKKIFSTFTSYHNEEGETNCYFQPSQ